MNIRTILVYMSTVIVGIVTATTSLVPAREETIIPKSCTMERIFKMIGYDCSDMNLKEVPQYLRTDLQVSIALKLHTNKTVLLLSHVKTLDSVIFARMRMRECVEWCLFEYSFFSFVAVASSRILFCFNRCSLIVKRSIKLKQKNCS